MTERARAKEARKQEVNALTGDGVRKIAAATAAQQDDRILQVAAYCRVSTDDIDQALSIELQKANYCSSDPAFFAPPISSRFYPTECPCWL